MNINEVIKETTTSGAVATVAAPMSTQKRNNVGKGVYGNEKQGTLFTGKKTNKKYANSVKEESANHALMLHASGDIDVRNNVVTSEQSLSESQIFTSKQQVIDYFVKRGKPAKQGAAAWERGWRGPGSTTKKSNVPVVKKERSDWMYKWEKEQEDKMKSRELNEVQLEEEDKLIDPTKGKKRKTGLHGKNEESRLTGFKHPFKSSGDFVSDSRGNKVCECENSDLAKEVTKALNAYVKKDESVIPGSIASEVTGEDNDSSEEFKKGQTVYLKTRTLPNTPTHGKVEKVGEKMVIISTIRGKYKAKKANVTADKSKGFLFQYSRNPEQHNNGK